MQTYLLDANSKEIALKLLHEVSVSEPHNLIYSYGAKTFGIRVPEYNLEYHFDLVDSYVSVRSRGEACQ